MSTVEAYSSAAVQAIALLEQPEVAAAWEKPSALAQLTVGGLAGHLASQIFVIGSVLDQPASEEAPIALLEHYARATWVGAPLDSEANAGIRARSEGVAAEGAQALCKRAQAEFAVVQSKLARLSGDQAVFLPWTGWVLTLDDLLATRLLEFSVHMDDLAVSVGLATPELAAAVFDPVLILLARLAARRHGQAALLRALARAERVPAAINVF